MDVLFLKEFGEEEQEYFFKSLLPKIIECALKLPALVTRPPLLLNREETKSLSFSQKQVKPCFKIDTKISILDTDFF